MSRNRITLLASASALILAAYLGGPISPLPASAATITVDTSDDADPPADNNGDCSLREAIDNANDDVQTHDDCEAGTGEDTIVFNGVALVTLAAALPDITDEDGLTIDGADAVTVSGASQHRPFRVNADAELTLDGITSTLGLAGVNGGNIENHGTLTLIDSEITDSNASLNGGAVYNGGTLTATGTTFMGNSALNERGGAIYNAGIAVLNGSTVTGNTADDSGAGIQNSTSGAARTGDAVVAGVAGNLTLNGSTVSNNITTGDGGGIWSNGDLTLNDSTVGPGNDAEQGGGIFNQGDAEITNGSQITGNTAGFGAGIRNSMDSTVNINSNSGITGNTATDFGGGINNSGTVNLVNSALDDNQATSGGGGGIEHARGNFIATGSSIDGNAAGSTGGGIDVFDGLVVTSLTNSTVSGNSAGTNGGGIYFDRAPSTLTLDSTAVSGNEAQIGGGIYNGKDSIVEIANGSNVSGNTAAANTGGIRNGGSLTITDSTIADNTAETYNGGIFGNEDSTTTVLRSTISGNTATTQAGGGVATEGGFLLLANTTVTGNSAATQGGGVWGTAVTANATVTRNTAATGAGIYGVVTLFNTIVVDQASGADCDGMITSEGNNVDSDNTCNLDQPTDIPNGNANLGPLADNGGPTLTHTLLPGSDAIDAGDDIICASPEGADGVDQRGVARPQGPHCDIGAFELQPATPTPSPTSSASPTATLTPTPTGGTTATPTPNPSPTPQANAIWADDDCNLTVAATDALKKLQDVAGIPYNVEPGCPTLGDSVGVQPAGFGDLTWGDTDCDGDYDAVDALQILRHIAGLPVNQTQPCPAVARPVLID